MKILCNILLPKDRVHAIPAEIGKKIKPTPTIDKPIKTDVVPIIPILSIDFNFVFKVLKIFLFLFGFVFFIFEVSNHFFNVVDMVIKTVYVIYIFSNECSKALFSNGAEAFRRSVFFLLYSKLYTNLPKYKPFQI